MNHYVMLTEARSEEAKAIRKATKDRDFSPRRGKILVPRKDQLVNALQTGLTKDHYVLVIPKSTNMHQQFIKSTSQNIRTMATSPKSKQKNSKTSTYLSEDSLASLLASLESGEDLKIPEGRCSLNLREYCEQSNLDYSSLRMLKDFSATTTDRLSEPSSPRLMSWGMTANGKCLTARITESHKIGKECSLSDILEEQVDQKYFLSQEATAKILNNSLGGIKATESMEQTA